MGFKNDSEQASESAATAPPGARRWPWIIGAGVLAVVVGIGVCEAAGWPFLVVPMQRWVSRALERTVSFSADAGGRDGVRIGFLGSLRVTAPTIEIGAPSWSKSPHMVLAHNAQLELGYGDLWQAYRGGPLHIRQLRADQLDAQLERRLDGRASWQFGAPKPEDPAHVARLPTFGELRVGDGTLGFRDEVLAADMDARFSLTERGTPVSLPGASSPTGSTAPGAVSTPAATASSVSGLHFSAKGSYRKLPLRVELLTSSVLSLAGPDAAEANQPVTLDATIGRAKIAFRGTASDPLHLTALRGRFDVQGPSLAAVGDPLGVTLPTTGAFKTDGFLTKQGSLWKAVFNQALIGESRLAGAFTFERGRAVPLLSGRVTGSRLLLKDLGPTLGGAPGPAGVPAKTQAAAPGADAKVLPDRRFDLPALRAMDANVLIDIAQVDLGTPRLESLEPLHTHLRLAGGVLTLSDLDARTAQGRLSGDIGLDGRSDQALWSADLRLLGVRLERWLHLGRKNDAPPYVTGQLDGQVKVSGKGRSTAEILGSLNGGMRFHLRDGSISHLAVEVAGIDIAQALGMMVKGDDALAVHCNVADLAIDKGVARPRVFVIDTRDSTVWIDGTVSLDSEALDLRAVVSPKDFSPLTVRSPIHVKGTFSSPKVSLEAGTIGAKVGVAALLSLLNPLAAVIPFIDPGSTADAQREAAQCATLVQRGNVAKVAPVKAASR